MTTRAPGLTAAMRKMLEELASPELYIGRGADLKRLVDAGFARKAIDHMHFITPRGQAALAAPRMTAAELSLLERIEKDPNATLDLGYSALHCKGWVEFGALTPAGLTALNNMRAAMGSAEWRETP